MNAATSPLIFRALLAFTRTLLFRVLRGCTYEIAEIRALHPRDWAGDARPGGSRSAPVKRPYSFTTRRRRLDAPNGECVDVDRNVSAIPCRRPGRRIPAVGSRRGLDAVGVKSRSPCSCMKTNSDSRRLPRRLQQVIVQARCPKSSAGIAAARIGDGCAAAAYHSGRIVSPVGAAADADIDDGAESAIAREGTLFPAYRRPFPETLRAVVIDAVDLAPRARCTHNSNRPDRQPVTRQIGMFSSGPRCRVR